MYIYLKGLTYKGQLKGYERYQLIRG